MDFERDLEFVHNLGLIVNIFGKDLKRSFHGCKDCKIFIVVTRKTGDELYHPDPEPDMSKLRRWIRCGDPTGLRPEWNSVDTLSYDAKVYLAGQDPGIDFTSVMDDMFIEKGRKTYAYTYRSKGILKVSHPYECLSLSTSSLSLLQRKALTIALAEHCENAWRAAEDFTDLLHLNQKFLVGEISETPYHCGPIDDETVPLVKNLLRLHDFQLLTDGSQPYEDKRPFRHKNDWVQYEQRPFVSFIMPALHDYEKLFTLLRRQREIVVQAYRIKPYRVLRGSDKKVVVSRERTATKIKDLRATKWKTYTTALNRIDRSEEEDYFDYDAVKRSKPVVFEVAAREWGVRLDLLGKIEEAATGCGLPLKQ